MKSLKPIFAVSIQPTLMALVLSFPLVTAAAVPKATCRMWMVKNGVKIEDNRTEIKPSLDGKSFYSLTWANHTAHIRFANDFLSAEDRSYFEGLVKNYTMIVKKEQELVHPNAKGEYIVQMDNVADVLEQPRGSESEDFDSIGLTCTVQH